MEVELKLRSSKNATTVAFVRITGGKVVESGGGEASLHQFSADKKIASSACIAQATSYCLLPDSF